MPDSFRSRRYYRVVAVPNGLQFQMAVRTKSNASPFERSSGYQTPPPRSSDAFEARLPHYLFG
jgi:hypothetical protein